MSTASQEPRRLSFWFRRLICFFATPAALIVVAGAKRDDNAPGIGFYATIGILAGLLYLLSSPASAWAELMNK